MNRQRDQQDTDPEEDLVEAYRQASKFADKDSLHDVIARSGTKVLRQSVPYIVTAARWHQASDKRRETRRHNLQESIDVDADSPPSLWDPYERVALFQELRAIADALATLPDEDVFAIWKHLEGYSDEEIRERWISSGMEPQNPTTASIRQRRKRALDQVKACVRERLQSQPKP